MGFLSKLRDRVNAQIGQPTFDNPDGRMYAGGSPGLYAPGGRFNRGGRGSRIMPNQGIPSLPQNLDFLSRLPKNMMPKVDFSNIPQLPENFQFNPQMGQGGTSLNFADYKPQDRQIMQYGGEARPGYAFGGPSQMTQGSQHMMPDGRQMPGANHAEYEANMQRPGYAIGGPLSRAALAKISGGAGKGINLKDIPYQGMIGTKAGLGSGKFTVNPGGLAAQARTIPSFGPTQATIGALGVGVAADATQGFSEDASRRNMMFNSPEQFGKDLAGLKIGFDQVMQIASNKAQEIGDVTGEYVDRVRQSYSEEMENQRMQELDAQQGIKPFSLLMGPDMPFRRPEPTEGRTTSDIDDLLSSMEKKN